MKTAKVFKSGNSQAVRLPKEFRIDAREVYIKRNGGNLKLMPREDAWKVFSESLSLFTDDFMESRKQPTQRKRGELFD
ncbi:MAG: AbrB/MazE/SpoVT family DNA-binding domain-containing protein [Thermoplasmata archaeon]|nr:AbrB/MazE/SpoVT family DNA-binding domain-containing protein [Candidatus Sysuiplasma acidicola]